MDFGSVHTETLLFRMQRFWVQISVQKPAILTDNFGEFTQFLSTTGTWRDNAI